MKSLAPLLLAALGLMQPLASAQHRHISHASTHATASSSGPRGCIHIGEISDTIPASPAGSCPKALYTLSTVPAVRLDYASPMANQATLHATFPLESTSITLAYNDIQTGSGAFATPGKYLSILYTGYLADGTVFDSSAKHNNEPIVIQYGKHGVIPGWDTGLDGMRVGGKRRLYIPYQLAYGANGQPPVIPAKAELVFDVEFVSQSDSMPSPKPAPAVMPPSTKPSTTPPTATEPAAAPKP